MDSRASPRAKGLTPLVKEGVGKGKVGMIENLNLPWADHQGRDVSPGEGGDLPPKEEEPQTLEVDTEVRLQCIHRILEHPPRRGGGGA